MSKHHPFSRSRRGISLVETAAATLIAGICISATASAVYVVTRAGAGWTAGDTARRSAVLPIERMRDELRLATALSELKAAAVTFTHPDVTGDNLPDVVRYSWSGVEGHPLVRSVNGSSHTMIEACKAFSLASTLIGASEEQRPAQTDIGLLASHNSYPLAYITRNQNITSANWMAEYFTPQTSGATSCTITSVWLYVRRPTSGTVAGNLEVSIQNVKAGTYNPDLVPLAKVSVAGAGLPTSYTYMEFAFPGGVTVPNGQPVLIVMSGTGSNTAEIQYNDLGSLLFDDNVMGRNSSTAGMTWSPSSSLLQSRDVRFAAYGYFTMSGTVGTGRYATGSVGALHVHLKGSGAGSPTTVDTAVSCANRPSVQGMNISDVPLR